MASREQLGIVVDDDRNSLLTEFGKTTLADRYLLDGETYQDLFARVSTAFSDDLAHAQRLYDYMSRLWFMPATPVLSNGGTTRGLPISCYLNEVPDSMSGITGIFVENSGLASSGGGIGTYWGNLRSLGEKVGQRGSTSGVIPFMKIMDSQTLAVSQGSLRRGSAAVYLRIDHPEIEEFLQIRREEGGDTNRKCLNLHHGIGIPDSFMHAVERNEMWGLISPKTGDVIREVSARDLWGKILELRMLTGEPYLIWLDTINAAIPEWHKKAGLVVKTSNLCSEITLPTTSDRTAVCCLSSLNLEMYPEWKGNRQFVIDVMRFLDNVLENFIQQVETNPKYADLAKAAYAARQERSVGLGVMGFHSFLQRISVPWESPQASFWNTKVFEFIQSCANEASRILAEEKGPCPDAAKYGYMERFSNKTAIAPTASISIICGGASPVLSRRRRTRTRTRPCPDRSRYATPIWKGFWPSTSATPKRSGPRSWPSLARFSIWTSSPKRRRPCSRPRSRSIRTGSFSMPRIVRRSSIRPPRTICSSPPTCIRPTFSVCTSKRGVRA